MRGVIHRDIKPSNLIVTPENICYLVDFGISLRKSDLDRLTQSPIGTPGYMSPEQEKNGTTDATTDIYSLGIVLYECLAGTRPLVGGYRSLSTFNEAIPPAIDSLVKQCLGDPAGRPTTPSTFLSMLNQALTPHASFTDVLANGSLYEIEVAVSRMSPGDYRLLKLGQRIALSSRAKDLVNVDQENMRRATAQLLSSLVRAAQLDPQTDYAYIVEQALQYGYEKKYDYGNFGNSGAREALNDVAITATAATHAVLSGRVLAFLADTKIEGKPRWYFHDLRVLLQNLLVNPQCSDDDALKLGAELHNVNSLSHEWGLTKTLFKA
jgi:serine/threonine protein kinase